jgi:uncharacterized phiE125 gp8 family phage protein
MGLTLVTPPDGEPVVATEAIDHLRLEADTDEDALIASLVTSAREIIETQTGRALITQTWELTLDRFPCGTVGYGASWVKQTQIQLPKPPIQSVTSVKYIDTDGVLQTLASTEYVVDTTSMRGRIVPAFGKVWPSTRATINAVTIRFVAGYGDAAKVPESLKNAMKLMLGGAYENRESLITGTIVADNPTLRALIEPYRVLEAV